MISPETNVKTGIGIVVLAAGASSRLGEPKQLLSYHNKSLLQHSINEALKTNAEKVVVVLGANAGQILPEMENTTATVIINRNWQEGMGSSIRFGLKELLALAPELEAVVVMVCDQPFVTFEILDQLVRSYQFTGKKIIACSYDNSFGPPVLFQKSFFPNLLQLTGEIGARSIIRNHPGETEHLPFPQGIVDVDTKEDYAKLCQDV